VVELSRITSRGRTVIPERVRGSMYLSPGDSIAWEVAPDGSATARRVQPLDHEYLRALERTLTEWASPEDVDAYRDL